MTIYKIDENDDDLRIVNLRDIAPGAVSYVNHPLLPNLAQLAQSKPNETWCAIKGSRLAARCSLWSQDVVSYQGYKTAALGHFFAQEQHGGALLLEHACQRLAGQGIEYVIGPMDGSTWRNYRLVTHHGAHSPFFLEAYTPCDWPAIFAATGFTTIATYSSAQTVDLHYPDPSAQKFAARAEALGLSIRPFDVGRMQEELTALYTVSVQSFAHNFLYAPIALSDFLALYAPLTPYLAPDLFLLAEQAGQLVGFVFAIPDYQQKARGEAMDTVIIKTLARLPGRAYAGLGSYLAQELHRRAAQQGYRSVIHALMHDVNASRTISNKSAQTIRQYALYGKLVDQRTRR